MLINIDPAYFMHSTHSIHSGGPSEVVNTRRKATKRINASKLADFLASAPPEVVALANITAAMKEQESKSGRVDNANGHVVTFYEVVPLAGKPTRLLCSGDVDHYDINKNMLKRSAEMWLLDNVVEKEKQYYFLTTKLEEWLRSPERPEMMATLEAICA